MDIKNETNIYKKVLLLAVPMMIQSGITNAVGLVDNLMVGSLGTESITAVSISVQLVFVYSLAVFGGLSGPSIYCAQYFGKGDDEGIRKVFRIKIWIVLACIIGGFIVFTCFDDFLINLYLRGESAGIDKALTLSISKEYLRIMLIGLVPFSITQVYSSTLRETNDSFKPMVSGIISVVCDIILNYALIFGHFGFPELGVKGAAYATLLSRIVEMLVIIIWAHAKIKIHGFLQGAYKSLIVSPSFAIPLLKKGFPIFINEFLWATSMAVLTQCYSLRGLDVVAGINISNAICNLLNVAFITLGSAVGIIIGQMLGAMEFDKAKHHALKLAWFCALVSVVTAVILIVFSGIFPRAYNTTEDIRQLSKMFIIITAFFFPVQGYLNSLYFTLRAGGRTVITFIFDSGYSWLILVPFAFILSSHTNLGILSIYALIQTLDIIKSYIGYILVKRGIWITNLIN